MKAQLRILWQTNKPMTGAGILLLSALVPTMAGIFLDPRMITGAPAWLKPAKFAISTSIYLLTLAWVFRYLPHWPRLRSITGWISAVVMIVEVAIICVQAARGTTSHFNISTPFDATLFATMGIGILIAWLASVAVAVALFRERFTDPVFGWAMRLGMLISVIGAASGGLMTKPTPHQLAEVQVTHEMPIVGAHTVGAPDGGPGLPGVGWSREHGDLRVPHFLGLHAIQILPFVIFLWKPKRSRAVLAAAAAYGLVFGLTLTQALAGKPLWGGL